MAACASVMDLMVERREAKGVHGEEAEKKKKGEGRGGRDVEEMAAGMKGDKVKWKDK